MFRSLYQVMEVTIVTKTLPICHSDFRAGEELFFRSRKKKTLRRPHPAKGEVNMWRTHHMDLSTGKYHTWKEVAAVVPKRAKRAQQSTPCA